MHIRARRAIPYAESRWSSTLREWSHHHFTRTVRVSHVLPIKKPMRPRALVQTISLAFVVVLLCSSCATVRRAAPHTVSAKHVLFFDDFNGSSLNLKKWQPNWLAGDNRTTTKPVNSHEASCYAPSQVSVGSGSLHLRATSRRCRASNGHTYSYASGLVNTRKHFTFTYGRLEARIWMPPGTSSRTHNWPAFWANGTGTWPKTGEIDVVEGLSGSNCYHFHSPSGGPGGCAPMRNAGGWHTFAADWRPGRVSYLYDGKQVGTIRQGITNSPMFLILNLGVSSSISPPIRVPSEMRVDYVRVTA